LSLRQEDDVAGRNVTVGVDCHVSASYAVS